MAGSLIVVYNVKVTAIKLLSKIKTENKESVLQGVHLVTSLFKRVILGTFHGRLDSKYLQRYLDEYVFRFNRRTTKSIGKRFWRIMQQAVTSAPIPKDRLIQEFGGAK